MKTRFTALVFALGSVLAAWPALAVEVFRWTDENGVIHFSQWAPEEGVRGVRTVRVVDGGEKDNGIGVSESDDPEGYRAHRAEMDALWAEIELRREAERERQARAPATEIVYLPAEQFYGYPYFFPGHGLRPPFKPDQPPHRPRPEPPPNLEEPLPSVPFRRP